MKKLLHFVLVILSFLSLCASTSSAQTIVRMTIEGVFTEVSGAGHPDIDIGDSFSFSVVFDSTQMTGQGTAAAIISAPDADFLVNDAPHAFVMPPGIDFFGDRNGLPPIFPSMPAFMQARNEDNVVNLIAWNPAPIASGYPTDVGMTVEASDLPFYNDIDPASILFRFYGSAAAPNADYILGPATSYSVTVIPEPTGALLGGLAGLAVLGRRMRGDR